MPSITIISLRCETKRENKQAVVSSSSIVLGHSIYAKSMSIDAKWSHAHGLHSANKKRG